MSDADYSELAARVLAARPDEPRAPRVDRDRGISIVAQAMAERTRRRRARRAWFGGLAGVALIALAAGAWLRFDASSERAACGADCDAAVTGHSGQASFPPGSHWTAGNAGLSVGFGRVTRLDLDPSSEVLYQSADGAQRFRLLSGALHARVEKLGSGQRFIVETQDVEAEVRGTAFDVALTSTRNCGSSTRVTVREGVVEVRAAGRAYRLRAGESWPGDCDDEAAASEREHQPAPSLSIAALPSRLPPATPPSAAPSAPLPPRSNLVEQNDLYARAVAARRAGRPSLALELYAELTRRFPAGALVESALIERVRILQKLDPARASTEARAYLRRFPNGFAREEALEVLAP